MNKIIAHRGFSSRKLENTLESFELAFSVDYIDIVELDIRMTKDYKIVCVHDGFIRNNFNLKSNIKDLNYNDLKKPITNKYNSAVNIFRNIKNFRNLVTLIKYSHKKGNIPLLEDVLEMLPLNKKIVVEIKVDKKSFDLSIYENKIVEILEKYNNKKISIMSFDQQIILNIKKRIPKLKIGLLLKKEINDVPLIFDFYSIQYNFITQELFDTLIKNHKKVFVWTVDNYSEFLLLKKRIKKNFSKIGITTNFPDLIYYLLKK